MRERILKLLDEANTKLQENPEKKEKISKLDRTVCIELDDSENIFFEIKNGSITVVDHVVSPDIVVKSSSRDFSDILDKKLDPMNAYFSKKIVIKAKLMDKLLIANILK
ncbi:SCP2 sterol-binding domain-containing protein [Oxyplasma meridianum]|uniref:SCP2 sterol-binding domain-containing protein n=1 Tax=Oxyplasma meridianum TaxID=3073602 RepID=A0AAX4NJD3_9ARCH